MEFCYTTLIFLCLCAEKPSRGGFDVKTEIRYKIDQPAAVPGAGGGAAAGAAGDREGGGQPRQRHWHWHHLVCGR